MCLCAFGVDRSAHSFEVEELLPADGTVDVMQVVVPPRLEELNNKILSAVSQDLGWWLNHLRNAPPGEVLPYDARLGLSKEEFDEYQTLSMTLRKVTTAKIRIERDGSRIMFDGDEILGDLKDVELDIETGSVRTPFGEASKRYDVTASDGQRITGPWDGISWNLRPGLESTAESGQVEIVFAIGRLAENARGILYYRVKAPSKLLVLTVLQYDLPTAH